MHKTKRRNARTILRERPALEDMVRRTPDFESAIPRSGPTGSIAAKGFAFARGELDQRPGPRHGPFRGTAEIPRRALSSDLEDVCLDGAQRVMGRDQFRSHRLQR